MKIKMSEAIENLRNRLIPAKKQSKQSETVTLEAQPDVNNDDADWKRLLEITKSSEAVEINYDRKMIRKIFDEKADGAHNPFGIPFSRIVSLPQIRERMWELKKLYLEEPKDVSKPHDNKCTNEICNANAEQRREVLVKINHQGK